MEIRTIFRYLARKWWIFLPVFLVTLGVTTLMTLNLKPIYQARATFIVRPSQGIDDPKLVTSALDSLNRQPEIVSTYAEVARSRLIKVLAAASSGIPDRERKNFTIDSRTLAGTNIVEITVDSGVPEDARDYANSVGEETATYMTNIYPAYELVALDRAIPPGRPDKPNRTLNIIMGGVLGIFLGIVAVLLAVYLQGGLKESSTIEEGSTIDVVRAAAPAVFSIEQTSLHREFVKLRTAIDETRQIAEQSEKNTREMKAIFDRLASHASNNGQSNTNKTIL